MFDVNTSMTNLSYLHFNFAKNEAAVADAVIFTGSSHTAKQVSKTLIWH